MKKMNLIADFDLTKDTISNEIERMLRSGLKDSDLYSLDIVNYVSEEKLSLGVSVDHFEVFQSEDVLYKTVLNILVNEDGEDIYDFVDQRSTALTASDLIIMLRDYDEQSLPVNTPCYVCTMTFNVELPKSDMDMFDVNGISEIINNRLKDSVNRQPFTLACRVTDDVENKKLVLSYDMVSINQKCVKGENEISFNTASLCSDISYAVVPSATIYLDLLVKNKPVKEVEVEPEPEHTSANSDNVQYVNVANTEVMDQLDKLMHEQSKILEDIKQLSRSNDSIVASIKSAKDESQNDKPDMKYVEIEKKLDELKASHDEQIKVGKERAEALMSILQNVSKQGERLTNDNKTIKEDVAALQANLRDAIDIIGIALLYISHKNSDESLAGQNQYSLEQRFGIQSPEDLFGVFLELVDHSWEESGFDINDIFDGEAYVEESYEEELVDEEPYEEEPIEEETIEESETEVDERSDEEIHSDLMDDAIDAGIEEADKKRDSNFSKHMNNHRDAVGYSNKGLSSAGVYDTRLAEAINRENEVSDEMEVGV